MFSSLYLEGEFRDTRALRIGSEYYFWESENSGIFALNRLRLLDFSNNFLSDNFPTGIYTLHNLKELHLQGNQFSDSIPFDIGLCPHLLKLDLSNNFCTGEIFVCFSFLLLFLLIKVDECDELLRNTVISRLTSFL